MKPNLRPAYQRVGIAAGISVLVATLLLWFVWDGGALAESYEQERQRYERRKGEHRLADLVREYDNAIAKSQRTNRRAENHNGYVGSGPIRQARAR